MLLSTTVTKEMKKNIFYSRGEILSLVMGGWPVTKLLRIEIMELEFACSRRFLQIKSGM
jgi:hypothetical protein